MPNLNFTIQRVITKKDKQKELKYYVPNNEGFWLPSVPFPDEIPAMVDPFAIFEDPLERLCIVLLLLSALMLDKLPPSEELGDGLRFNVFPDVECSRVLEITLRRVSSLMIFLNTLFK